MLLSRLEVNGIMIEFVSASMISEDNLKGSPNQWALSMMQDQKR